MSIKFSMYIILYLIFTRFASHYSNKTCLSYVCTVNDCDECGHIKLKPGNKRRSKANSRIINGRETEDIYYWMAAIRRKQIIRPRVPPIRQKYENFFSTGAIITSHSIVTVGHALCFNTFYSDLDDGWVADRTCPQGNVVLQNQNLNVRDTNEINVVTGSKEPIFPDTFDDNVAAYLYNYVERNDPLFSQNGDFGVIILKKRIEFIPDLVSPICLLNRENPGYYNKTPQIEVKVAGWGFKYHEYINPVTNFVEKTTCHTNEGRTTNRHNITTFEERLPFLYCQIPDPDPNVVRAKTFCNRDLLSNGLETLPQNMDLQRIARFSGPASPLDLNSVKRDSQQQECEKYMRKARMAWSAGESLRESRQFAQSNEFDNAIDRIVIKGIYKKKEEIVCYNLRKVARYGVCLTRNVTHNGLAAPRNWGFCSRSCSASEDLFDDEYDVADFKYFERVPNTNDVFTGNLFLQIGNMMSLIIF